MGLMTWLKSLFGRTPRLDEIMTPDEIRRFERSIPPRDVHDAAAWDEYWKNQVEDGIGEQGFSDFFSSDPSLIDLLHRRDVRTVLCAGTGLSMEPLALALHGFDVTALDLSRIPERFFGIIFGEPDHPLRAIPGFRVGDDGVVTFVGSDPIDPALCPEMHADPRHAPACGGTLRFVTGDLVDPAACPGPFDAIIERRTVQLFERKERDVALERLVSRLAARGLFVSHQHSGGWRPGESREHFGEKWLRSRGFEIASSLGPDEAGVVPRLAHLFFSSG